MGFSKTDSRCLKCLYFDDCNNKRLVACAYAVMSNAISEVGIIASQPIIKEKVDIHITGDISVEVNKNDLIKNIEKQMFKKLQCPFTYGA